MENKIDFDRIERRAAVRKRTFQTVDYVLLTLWALLVLFPFYWMVLTSIKSYGSYNAEYIPKFYTVAPTLQNYADAFTTVPLGRYFLNTIIYTLVTTGLMMIPNELVIITNFVTITNLGLRNTYTGLILPSVTSVFYIYLLKENFEQIPDELYRAAQVDGTTDLRAERD